VYAETSNGTHSDEVIKAKAWVFLNRKGASDEFTAIDWSNTVQDKQYPAWVGLVNAFYDGEKQSSACLNDMNCGPQWYANVEVPRRKAALNYALTCYLDPTCGGQRYEKFKNVYTLVHSVYDAYIRGDVDPTQGSLFFADQTKLERNQTCCQDIQGLHNLMETNFSNYKQKDPTFGYWISQPYVAGGKNIVTVTGSNVCAAVGACR
jgi:hypothetical protein